MTTNKNIEYIKGIFLFFLYSLSYILLVYLEYEESYNIFSIFVYIQCMYIIIGWKRITYNVFDSYILFSIALYIFSLGHSFLDIFNAVSDRFSLTNSWSISPLLYLRTKYITLTFLLAFHFGAIKSYKIKNVIEEDINKKAYLKSLKKLGMLGVFFSLPFYIYNLILSIQTIIYSGYSGLYETENLVYGSASYYRILSDFFVPSIICLLFYSELLKKNRLLIYTLSFLFVCIPPLIIGSRTNSVIMCGIMFLIYSLFNKIPYRKIIIFSLLGYISIFTLVTIRNYRNSVNKENISEMITSTNKDENVITSIISEMGWSMYPISKTIEIKDIKTEKFLYGSSFLWSFTTIIPNLFWEKHPAKENADMSNWITQKLNFTYGIGFSLVAEAYVNFGIFGFIFMFLLGNLFEKLFEYSSFYNIQSNLILGVISVIFLWFIIRIVRNNFLDTIRYLCYYIIPFYCLLKHFSNKYKRIYTN